jgi:Rhs element Vgr protein
MSELFIPNPSRHDVATFNILVNDKAIDPSYQILSISIIKEINRIPLAKIILRDGEASERDFEISNKDDLVPGKKIKIKIGFDGNNAQAFKGIIVKHAIRIRENGNTELHIECQDETVKMTIGRKSRYFEKIKDSRLFDELIGAYNGLQSDPETTKLEHKELVQHHISDWDFMLLRAEANAMLVHVNDGVIQIKKPNTSAAPVLQVSYGSSVLELEAEMDARTQWKNVEAASWDYANQQLFRADTSEASSFAQHGNIAGDELANTINLTKYQLHHSGHLPEQELQDWADGIMLRSRLSKIRGRAKFTGFAGIKPGDMVKLEGVGNRFKGKSFVTAVKQEIGNGMWDTHIQFGLNPSPYVFEYSDMNDAQSAGLAGAIHGLQIGKVVQLQNDPDGEDRILVKIPVIDNNAQGIWTRMASLDAGADRGAFFRPEIDDEVIVGFINDDPRDAIVLGMLHSSAKPAPIKAQDVNHEKGFTTRSKMHIHFNDDTKTITIDTPAGNKIMLDESATKIEITDQSNNKITMEPNGIKIESPLNIDIKAGAVLTLSAGASLSIGAPALSMKADASVSIEGATAKFASQGPNVISGLPVMIN